MRELKLGIFCLLSVIINFRSQVSGALTNPFNSDDITRDSSSEENEDFGQKGGKVLPPVVCGLKGSDGIPGPPGAPGRDGLPGPPGMAGFPGAPGMKGPKGEIGIRGPPGAKGESGDITITSDTNVLTVPGPKGEKGEIGYPGIPGLSGISGLPGRKGESGLPGKDCLNGALFVRHSQTSQIPICPRGHTKIWDGYSFLYTEEKESCLRLNLGFTGSCIPRFSTTPLLSCDFDSGCENASRNDKSYWLSTILPIPKEPLSGYDIQHYISRCAICEAPSNVIAIHSQSLSIPDCPEGWTGLWIGFSFVLHTGALNDGRALTSPGSCLEDFRTSPIIECNGMNSTCHFPESKKSFWLATIDPKHMFDRPVSETVTLKNMLTRVSRCQVCIFA